MTKKQHPKKRINDPRCNWYMDSEALLLRRTPSLPFKKEYDEWADAQCKAGSNEYNVYIKYMQLCKCVCVCMCVMCVCTHKGRWNSIENLATSDSPGTGLFYLLDVQHLRASGHKDKISVPHTLPFHGYTSQEIQVASRCDKASCQRGGGGRSL